ncbi:MAG: hypothetical protein H0X27_00340 [Caulobacteraceae bacterium]|nr:hypothetical protein [Caulobacteraceae bacterium]
MRIVAAAACATLALPLAAMAATFAPWRILALFAWWNVFFSAAGTIGITSLQEAVPNEMRGVGVAMVAFGNIMGGLGPGTMTTALITDHLFHDPSRIAASLSLVVGPAAVAGCLLFWRAASRGRTVEVRKKPSARSHAPD